MHHSILEEHQVHRRDKVVVGHHRFLQQLSQNAPVCYGHVLWLADTPRKVTIDVRFVEHNGFVYFLKRLLHQVVLHFGKAVNVFVVEQFVPIDPLGLV